MAADSRAASFRPMPKVLLQQACFGKGMDMNNIVMVR